MKRDVILLLSSPVDARWPGVLEATTAIALKVKAKRNELCLWRELLTHLSSSAASRTNIVQNIEINQRHNQTSRIYVLKEKKKKKRNGKHTFFCLWRSASFIYSPIAYLCGARVSEWMNVCVFRFIIKLCRAAAAFPCDYYIHLKFFALATQRQSEAEHIIQRPAVHIPMNSHTWITSSSSSPSSATKHFIFFGVFSRRSSKAISISNATFRDWA